METATKPKKQLSDLTFNQIAKVRSELTMQIAEAEAAVQALKAKREKLDVEVLRRFNEDGMTSVKTEYGSLHTITRTSASCADKDAYMGWIKRTGNWDFLEVRPAKAMIETYMDEVDESTGKKHGLPPGINWSAKATIGMRKV